MYLHLVQAAAAFVESERFQEVMAGHAELCCSSMRIRCTTNVPSELGQVFRNGDDWATGVEFVLLHQARCFCSVWRKLYAVSMLCCVQAPVS